MNKEHITQGGVGPTTDERKEMQPFSWNLRMILIYAAYTKEKSCFPWIERIAAFY